MNDYHGNPLAIGDTIKNIENHWRGVVQDTEICGGQLMLVCVGVNFWDGQLDQDDKQWHTPGDVVKQPRQARQDGDPINNINLL